MLHTSYVSKQTPAWLPEKLFWGMQNASTIENGIAAMFHDKSGKLKLKLKLEIILYFNWAI